MLRAVLDTLSDAVVTIDQAGKICRANAAACRIFGYDHQELIGQNVSQLMPSPDREKHDGFLQAYLNTGQSRIIGVGREVLARRKDGSVFPVDLSVSEVVYDDTRLFTGIVRDMTDRQATQESLRRERAFIDHLFETSNAIILVLDPQARIIRFNPAMEQLSGYSLDEAAGKDWFEMFIPAAERDTIRDVFQAVTGGEPVVSHANAILTRQGEERMIAWSGKRLLGPDGKVEAVLAIGNDITPLKSAEQKVIQSERLSAIGQMVAGLAHESRNALQRSRACLDMLELDLQDNPDQRKLIRRIQDALIELQRLYEEVRNYAAPIKLDLADCDLAQLCRETWDQLHQQLPVNYALFRVQETGAPVRCRCDASRMQQVVRNILENALAVAPAGSEITVECETLRDGASPAVQLRFRDRGPGLTQEQASRIFEPFYTTKTKGTGLGMAIVKRIVEAHGGKIFANAVDGAGAEVVVLLPCQRAELGK